GRPDGDRRSKALIAAFGPVTARPAFSTMAYCVPRTLSPGHKLRAVEGAMDIVSRVKNILVDPKNEWGVIDGEPDDPVTVLKNYVAIVAAIPAVCGFIGTSIIGVAGYRTGIVVGLFGAVLNYVLTLVGVFVVAFIIDTLAEMFGGRKNFNS